MIIFTFRDKKSSFVKRSGRTSDQEIPKFVHISTALPWPWKGKKYFDSTKQRKVSVV